MNLAALLALLGLSVPIGLPADAIAVIQPTPIRQVSAYVIVNGEACSPAWGQPCDAPTARVMLDPHDLAAFRCAVWHEADHLALGPDTTADPMDGDAWWREARVYRETNEAVGPECPDYGG